jgi:uncharacterized protein YjbI with pentapeptide repeats
MTYKYSQPDLPRSLPAAADVVLETAATFESSEIESAAWAAQTAKRLIIETVRFDQPDFTSAQLREGSWTDVEISGGQLGGLNLTGSALRRTAIRKSRSSGTVFSEAEFKDVTFEDTKLDLANFRFSKLYRVEFIRCHLVDADFAGAQLSNVIFTNCDLTSADSPARKSPRPTCAATPSSP